MYFFNLCKTFHHYIFSQIVLIDLVLAGDNAIIIGMDASKFPVDQ